MAARTLANLVDTTQDDLLSGMINTLLKYDQFTANLIANAKVTDRPSIKFNRIVALPSAAYVDCTTSFTSQSISGAPVTVNLLTLAEQFAVCDIGQNLYSSFTDVLASEVDGALQSMSNQILADGVGSGNGSSAIYGLGSVATNSFAVATSGNFDLGDLDKLIDEVKTRSPNSYFVGAPATVRTVVAELRSATGGLQVQDLMGTAFKTPSYAGYNILKAEGAAAGSLYFVDPEQGYSMYFGTSEDMSIGGVFNMQDLGNSQTKMEKLYRIYAHIAGVSLNPQGIAKLTGV
jgi:hypothetical protein